MTPVVTASTLSTRGAVLKALATTSSRDIGTQLLTGINPGAVGYAPRRGIQQILDSYSLLPWLRATSQKISQHVGAVPWEIYGPTSNTKGAHRRAVLLRGLHDGGTPELRTKALARLLEEGLVEPYATHPFLDLLEHGNAEMPGLTVRRHIQLCIDLAGEAFLACERDRAGQTVAWWPLSPHWIQSTPTPSTPSFRLSYRGAQFLIATEDIVWIKDASPSDCYGRGSGIGLTLADEQEIDESSAKYLASWFRNSARPDLLISPAQDAEMGRADTVRLEQQWVQSHQGVHRAGKPLFLNRPVTVAQLGSNFREQQLTQLRDQQRDTTLRVLGGIPPELFGITVSANRSTIDMAEHLLATQVLIPRLELLRSHFQRMVSEEYDPRFVVTYVDPTPSDKAFRLRAMIARPECYTLDEVRALTGDERLPDEQGQALGQPRATPAPLSDVDGARA
jgi:phage portal protein BeeE